jgi:alpha-1,2-mannosyltransferase
VWFAPLVVHLGHRAYFLGGRVAAAAMWLLCAMVGGWFVSASGDTPQAGILSLRPGGLWREILPGAYVFVFLAVLLCTTVWLWRLPDTGGLTRSASHDLHDVERAHA